MQGRDEGHVVAGLQQVVGLTEKLPVGVVDLEEK